VQHVRTEHTTQREQNADQSGAAGEQFGEIAEILAAPERLVAIAISRSPSSDTTTMVWEP
jgi:hypothetical protein